MRTWLLAPDGRWKQVTELLSPFGGDVDTGYPWANILRTVSDDSLAILFAQTFTRSTLPQAGAEPTDRFVQRFLWGAACAPGVEAVTLLRIHLFGPHTAWLGALARWCGCTDEAPPSIWVDRRARWMLWAHATDTAPTLDGARIMAGVR